MRSFLYPVQFAVRAPSGWRSPDGSPQRFLPGIGQLLLRSAAPAVPTYIGGAFEALPRDRRIPKFRQITVAFGCPEPVETLRAIGDGRTDQERITDAVRQRVIAVGAASAAVLATAMPDPPAGQTDSIRR